VIVLSEESTNHWVEVLGRVKHEHRLVDEGKTEHLGESPSEGRVSTVWHKSGSLETEPKSSEVSNPVVSQLRLVQIINLFSISDRNVVRKEVALVSIVVEVGIEPVETVILNKELTEPWSPRYFCDSAEVSR
jgi:hypothetical protein